MEDTVTEAIRKQYEAYSYPPPIEDAEQFRKKCNYGDSALNLAGMFSALSP